MAKVAVITDGESAMRLPYCVLLLVLLMSGMRPSPARADDVTDRIDQALAAYKKHDLPTAVAALEVASNLARQAQADALKAVLLSPPSGWNADPPETNAGAVAAPGLGTTVSRTYYKDAQQVQVQINVGGGMVRVMALMLNGPIKATGMKSVVIGGRPMLYAANDNSLAAVVGTTTLVKVIGDRAIPEATLHDFVAAVDFAALEKLVH